MALVPVDLPDPPRLRARWAAYSAVATALGYGDGANAERGPWYYDDGGGNWVELHRLDGGRAVLLGHDHEYSDTYYHLAAEYFDEPETDLLAEAPEWWADPVRATEAPGRWIGFVYGFEDGAWRRADYEPDDGFTSVDPPFTSDERCHELITGLLRGPERNAEVTALIAADGDVTEQLVTAVVGAGADHAAGAAAARRFLA